MLFTIQLDLSRKAIEPIRAPSLRNGTSSFLLLEGTLAKNVASALQMDWTPAG
jgi:hypothetical protein